MEKGTTHYKSEHSKYELTVNIGELVPSQVLAGKNIIITGAARGIGFAIAEKCIAQGAKVIITDRDEKMMAEAKSALGKNCEFVMLDMLDFGKYDTVIEKAAEFFGDVDCLVQCAGISLHEGDFMNVTEKTWDAQLDINLKGPYFLTQAWLRYYEKQNIKNGKIVLLASDTSGMGSTIPYGLSKVGVSSFTRGLAKHVIKKGIRINAIAPGTTKTTMTDDFTKGEIIRDSTEGNRVLFPCEIAEVCVFLLSDASACMSGNVFGCTEANICFDNTADNLAGESETNP